MKKRIGIIGAGHRISIIFGDLLPKSNIEYILAAVADPDIEGAKKRLEDNKFDCSGTHFYADTDEMLDKEKLDGVVVGTRCNLHTPLAIKVMEKNIPLFLEKPVSIDEKQLNSLYEATKNYTAQSVVSFPLRYIPHVLWIKNLLKSGVLGRVSQIQAYNNVPYGGTYYKDWCRDESITGGLFMQKSTHDVDYINYILDVQPTEIFAVDSKTIFKGDKAANLKCKNCEEQESCSLSSIKIARDYLDRPYGEYCSKAIDTGNQDCGTIIMKYADGTHCTYVQNFVARKKAAKRGARFIGEFATAEFDMFTNTGNLFMHISQEVITNNLSDCKSGHGGGDFKLIMDFGRIMNGVKIENSIVEGIRSAAICLAAEKSARTQQVVKLEKY